MNYSNNTLSIANELASHYSKFDNILKQYTIDISNIADFDLHELAASIMSDDDSYASEATGPDNPDYDTKMLPALLRFMKNSSNKDEEIEFVKEWREGVTSYFKTTIQELLNKAVYNLNDNDGFLYSEDTGCRINNEKENRTWL